MGSFVPAFSTFRNFYNKNRAFKTYNSNNLFRVMPNTWQFYSLLPYRHFFKQVNEIFLNN